MQDWLPAGGLRLYREGVEPSGSLRKVSGYISVLLSRTSPVARVVHAKPPFAGPEQVLGYLGRYTHRVAIANSRLLGLDDDQVSFTWKDYRHGGQTKVMTCPAPAVGQPTKPSTNGPQRLSFQQPGTPIPIARPTRS